MYSYGAKFTVEREYMSAAQLEVERDHWSFKKDQVWLAEINEHIGQIVLNTVEDREERQAYWGETVKLTVTIKSVHPVKRTRKTEHVNHEQIRRQFTAQSVDAMKLFAQVQPEVAQVHVKNPFFRFIFGRGLWSYIPCEDSLAFDELLEGKTAPLKPELRGKSWSWMMYPLFPDQPPSIVPSSTNHDDWLCRVDTEWDYATDEQRELMQRCLAKMREDGHETPDL